MEDHELDFSRLGHLYQSFHLVALFLLKGQFEHEVGFSQHDHGPTSDFTSPERIFS